MLSSSMNQLGNAKNPHQGPEKKVLCVCSAGLLRSPTTANVLHRKYGFNTRAAGTAVEYALIPVSKVLLYWADEIVFVSVENFYQLTDEAREFIKEQNKKIIVLKIPDEFNWNDPQLRAEIERQYEEAQNA